MKKKAIMRTALRCLIVFAILMSAVPVSVFALADDITSISDTSVQGANEMVSALQAD